MRETIFSDLHHTPGRSLAPMVGERLTYSIEHHPGAAASTARVYLNGAYEDGATAEGGGSAGRFAVLHDWVADHYPDAQPMLTAHQADRQAPPGHSGGACLPR